MDFAKALIVGEKLGQNPDGVTDMITISVSSTDINGHAFGPDDPSQHELIVQSDVLLDAFFTFLDKTIGLKNVMVAMTGDHGVATSQKAGDAMGMPVLDFPAKQFTQAARSDAGGEVSAEGKGSLSCCRWTILTSC